MTYLDLADVAERFWSKVDRTNPDACWPWTASTQKRGYGQISVGGRPRIATRVCWELTNGPIPPGLFVCHRCDNPACVRPAHLFLGTPGDNIHDMDAKGRRVKKNPVGSKHGCAKLDEVRVAKIKRRIAAGEPQKELAREYGVSCGAINHIAKGRQWRHVTPEDETCCI